MFRTGFSTFWAGLFISIPSLAYASSGKISAEWGFFIIFSTLAITITGVILGLQNKAIFYYNKKKIALSLSPLIAFVIAITTADSYDSTKIIHHISTWATLLLFLCIAYTTLKFNKYNFILSFPVAVAKIILSFLILFHIYKLVFPGGRTANDRFGTQVLAGGILALLGNLMLKLLNGEAIYTENNWTPPKSIITR